MRDDSAARHLGKFAPVHRPRRVANDVFVLATASRYGDDPLPAVDALFDQLDHPEAVDIVAADTVALLAHAAENAGSAGSQRLADTMRTTTAGGVSGALSVGARSSATEQRTYRLLEIVDGDPQFRSLLSETGFVQLPK